MSFGVRLAAAMATRGPLCVGIDPHPQLLAQWELPDDITGLRQFADICLAAFAETAAVLKPQSAFFERFGSAGIKVLEDTLTAGRAAGALMLVDVKRGDIGSTMACYAQAYLDPAAPLAADAITLSPYLGVGSLKPAFDVAARYGAGVFVLCLTSNPEAAQIQGARLSDGRSVAQSILQELTQLNADSRAAGADEAAALMGSIGAVVGATVTDSSVQLAAFNGPFLVPGIGAQGGTTDDVRRLFGSSLSSVLPSVSREILRAGPAPAALRAAALRLSEQFAFLHS